MVFYRLCILESLAYPNNCLMFIYWKLIILFAAEDTNGSDTTSSLTPGQSLALLLAIVIISAALVVSVITMVVFKYMNTLNKVAPDFSIKTVTVYNDQLRRSVIYDGMDSSQQSGSNATDIQPQLIGSHAPHSPNKVTSSSRRRRRSKAIARSESSSHSHVSLQGGRHSVASVRWNAKKHKQSKRGVSRSQAIWNKRWSNQADTSTHIVQRQSSKSSRRAKSNYLSIGHNR